MFSDSKVFPFDHSKGSLPHLKTVEKAQMVFMLWVELEAVDSFLDAMEKAIKSQVAKAVLLAIDFMIQVLM
nr:hypothetical protein [Tanacetum cinerariifolium]